MDIISAELHSPVTGFQLTGPHIDCVCGRELVKLDKTSGEVLLRRTVFDKEGFSRDLIVDGGQIFVYDFCVLYAFRQEDYAPLGSWQLGRDLSSDICGLAVDGDSAYCSIRNGGLAVLDRSSGSLRQAAVSPSSMWSIRLWGEQLLCGTIDGRLLLLLDKDTLLLERFMVLGKKNIGSLYPDGGTLYAACHDGKLFKINLGSFEAEAMRRNAHRKMFYCAGVYGDTLVTVSYPCSEITLLDKSTLDRITSIETPLQLSGRACIDGDLLYLSSRNIPGVAKIRLPAGAEAEVQ